MTRAIIASAILALALCPAAEAQDAAPPWETARPAADAGEQTPAASAPAEQPPLPEKAPPADAGPDLWSAMLDGCKAKLSISKRVFLNMASGLREGGQFVIYCSSQLVADTLQSSEVLPVLLSLLFSFAASRSASAFAL